METPKLGGRRHPQSLPYIWGKELAMSRRFEALKVSAAAQLQSHWTFKPLFKKEIGLP
jgi:hypothetical protein